MLLFDWGAWTPPTTLASMSGEHSPQNAMLSFNWGASTPPTTLASMSGEHPQKNAMLFSDECVAAWRACHVGAHRSRRAEQRHLQ